MRFYICSLIILSCGLCAIIPGIMALCGEG